MRDILGGSRTAAMTAILPVLALLLAGSVPADAQQKTVIRFAHENSRTHPVGQGADRFAKRVAELTGGRVEIRVFPAGEMGSARAVLEATQLGTLEMSSAVMGEMANFAPEFDIISLPFLFRDYDHINAALAGKLGLKLQEAARKAGFEPVGFTTSGARQLYAKKPVRTAADVRGLKVRTMEVPVIIATWRALGAVVTPVAFPEVYTALQTGVVDAAESSFLAWLTASHYEVARYGIRINYSDSGRVYVLNSRFWSRLPADVQKAVRQAMDEAASFITELYVKGDAEAAKTATARGAEVINPELSGFVEAVQVVYGNFKPTLGMEWIRQIQEMK
jgi:TRAP-type transport system periplasmic protein